MVVNQFLFTWCPHCQAAAGWLSKMQNEWGGHVASRPMVSRSMTKF